MIQPFEGRFPTVHPTAYIAPSAVVIGDVTIGEGASIWPGAVLRGDTAPITVGAYTNIQDNCVVHGDTGTSVTIGNRVTIGHNVVMHGSIVGDNCLIGISSTILGKAEIGASCMIAAGAVVKEGELIPEGTFWLGVPAKQRGPVNYDLIDPIAGRSDHYWNLAQRHRASEESANAGR
jgi:carbonic anhydrase/acetyltransferase-like protein (isoleucine patch superfamily)